MCMITAATIFAGVAAAGAATSAIGAVRSGNDQASALKYNALVENQNAEATRRQGQAEAEQKGSEVTRRMADARAAIAASGIDPNSGTPLELMSDMATQGELSKKLITYQSELSARGLSQQAQLDLVNARNAKTAGYLNAASTVLTSAGKIGGSYYSPSKAPSKPSVMDY